MESHLYMETLKPIDEDEYASVSWNWEDVLQQATTDGYSLTKDECVEILGIISDNHDAAIGINWENISYHIAEYKEG